MNPYADVRPGGYAWWYFDAVSDDGARALTAIFFIGSVFSPSWAARVRRGENPRAEEHLGVNLALYERGKKR
ncbi:MAG TPA: carotenoid 1,2-hydratase, partial [Polyangia bacterium]